MILTLIIVFILIFASIGFYLGVSKTNPRIRLKLRSIPSSVLTLVIIWCLIANDTIAKNIWYLSSISFPGIYNSFVTVLVIALFFTVISYAVSYSVLWIVIFHFKGGKGEPHILVNYIIAPLICVAISTVYISHTISSFS